MQPPCIQSASRGWPSPLRFEATGNSLASPSTVDSASAHKLVITTIILLFICSRSLSSLLLIRLLASTHLSSTGTRCALFRDTLPTSTRLSDPIAAGLAVSAPGFRWSRCRFWSDGSKIFLLLPFHPFQPTYSARDLPDHCHIQTSARWIDRRYPLGQHLT